MIIIYLISKDQKYCIGLTYNKYHTLELNWIYNKANILEQYWTRQKEDWTFKMQSIRNERQACIKPQNLIGDRSFSIAGGGGVGWEDFDYVTVKFT